jgi:hypothetical protein
MTEGKNTILKHIHRVQDYLLLFMNKLYQRGQEHDQSKLDEGTELPFFEKYAPLLKTCEYGSEEYKKFLKELTPAIELHYRRNRHHPEHFDNKIAGMNLFDLVEMFCDWIAATEQHKYGDVFKSIEINQKRFGYSDDIKSILLNTANYVKKQKI